MKSQFCDLPGGNKLHYFSGGKAGKPKLLLLHGVTFHAEFFGNFFSLFGPEYEIFAPDLRGHGKSLRTPGHYSLADYSSDIHTFCSSVLKEPCFCLGMSLGGRVALYALISNPGIFSKLVLADVSPYLNPDGLVRMKNVQQLLPECFESYTELNGFYLSHYSKVSPFYRDTVIRYAWKKDSDGKYRTSYDRAVWQNPPEQFAKDQQVLFSGINNIKIPLLVLRGELSDILLKNDAEKFVNILENGKLFEIKKASHLLLLEKPEECCRIISEFFLS